MHQQLPVVHPEQSKLAWQRSHILFIETCCYGLAKTRKVHVSDSEVNDYLLGSLVIKH